MASITIPLKTAIIGCGRIASGFASGDGSLGIITHAQAYADCGKTRLVAVCDTDAVQAEACARQWNVPAWFTDPSELLERTHPDLISICTPDETHMDVTKSLLGHSCRPRGVLCEKPIALTVREAAPVIEQAARAGVKLAVNYSRRYVAKLRAVQQEICGGRLGGVQAINGWYTKGVLHNGTHWFDLIRYLFGEVVEVHARIAGEGTTDDPALDVTLRLKSGGRASLMSCRSQCFTVFEMDVMMEKGRVEFRDAALDVRFSVAKDSTRFPGHRELAVAPREFGDARDSLRHAVEDLADSVICNRNPVCTGADGLAALRIGEAAIESARNCGLPVMI